MTGVAGAGRHHADALASDVLAPGGRSCCAATRTTRTTRTRSRSTRPAGRQLGWVPRELATEIAPELDAGRTWSALMLREQRRSPRDPRTGVTMLLAPAEAIELRELSRGPAT